MCVIVDCAGLPKTRMLDSKHMRCGVPAPVHIGAVEVEKLVQVQAAGGAGKWKEATHRASAKRLERFDKTALVMVNDSLKAKNGQVAEKQKQKTHRGKYSLGKQQERYGKRGLLQMKARLRAAEAEQIAIAAQAGLCAIDSPPHYLSSCQAPSLQHARL